MNANRIWEHLFSCKGFQRLIVPKNVHGIHWGKVCAVALFIVSKADIPDFHDGTVNGVAVRVRDLGFVCCPFGWGLKFVFGESHCLGC